MKNENKLEKGYMFSFEGTEGCGKSTIIKEVKNRLEQKGYKVIVTREPGGCEVSEQIRNVILNNHNSNYFTELLLFLSARNEHFKKIIRPAINDGYIVLSDRFVDSTLAYQVYKIKDESRQNDMLRLIEDFGLIAYENDTMSVYPKCLLKSYYLRLDDVRTGLERIKKNNRETNKFDEMDIKFHEEIRDNYDFLYMKHNSKELSKRTVVSADMEIDKIVDSIVVDIENCLLNRTPISELRETVEWNYSMYNFVYFWGHKNGEYNYLSQWYHAPFVVNDVVYSCNEQFMMAQKAMLFKDTETLKRIMEETDPSAIKKLGREVKNFDARLWDAAKEAIVYRANYEKFHQNIDLGFKLLDFPENTVFVEASPYDKIWGIGMREDDARQVKPSQWKGKNLLGFILTEVKKDLQNKYPKY